MHICTDCRWIGKGPEIFTQQARLDTLLALKPGDPVPSGRCPNCSGLAIPVDLPALPVPGQGPEPFIGWRWRAAFTQGRDGLALYLADSITGAMIEIAIDAHDERPRLEITAFTEGQPVETAESQLLLSIGDGHVAAFPAADPVAQPLVYTEDGVSVKAAATRAEFDAASGARYRF